MLTCRSVVPLKILHCQKKKKVALQRYIIMWLKILKRVTIQLMANIWQWNRLHYSWWRNYRPLFLKMTGQCFSSIWDTIMYFIYIYVILYRHTVLFILCQNNSLDMMKMMGSRRVLQRRIGKKCQSRHYRRYSNL